MNQLIELFEKWSGRKPDAVTPMSGGGGSRRYYRLSAGVCGGAGTPGGDYCATGAADDYKSAIGVVGEDLRENRSFVALSRVFSGNGVKVPEIYAVSRDSGCYLQQDLGDVSLLQLLDGDSADSFLRRTIDNLVAMQTVPPVLWETEVYEAPFDRQLVTWDLNYFKYCFLKVAGMPMDEWALESEFRSLSDALCEMSTLCTGFMMRDCQSRNVMIHGDDCVLIDYQGGRCGPAVYDIVSLLWQARAGLSDDLRERCLDYYFSKYAERMAALGQPVSPDVQAALRSGITIWVLFRQLQVLGAYGLRGMVERKAHFLQSLLPGLAAALRTLRDIDGGALGRRYPTLLAALESVEASKRFQASVPMADGRLTVTVFSFSYKKGYPDDFSGNGGGFMFDCRGMHNPGRYDEFKPLTGMDRPVIDFLEERGEVQCFLANAEGMVAPAVECYRRRGFTSLQVGFGCTGGRHRSVYCAEHLAEALAERFSDVRIRLVHREQQVDRLLNS